MILRPKSDFVVYHSDKKERLLALDLATVVGHATIAHGIIDYGSHSFARKHKNMRSAPKHPGAIFHMFRGWLTEKIIEDKPFGIVYEEVMRFPYALQAHSFCGLRAILLETACQHGLPLFSYVPTAIKKFWTGKGNAKKQAMIDATRAKFPGIEITDDNQADALAMLHLHLSKIPHPK